MKKSILFLFAVLTAAAAIAHDFSAVSPSGHTLYYNINGSNVTVTSQNATYPFYTTAPTGYLTIPSSVTHNGTTYPVTAIGFRAFALCDGLESVTIPSSVTSIDEDAFRSCYGLIRIISKAATPPTAHKESFYDVMDTVPIYVPSGSVSAYSSATGWRRFRYILVDENLSIPSATQDFTLKVQQGSIKVEGCAGQPLIIADITGRLLVSQTAVEGRTYPLPHSGIYLVKIGSAPARKVIVSR